MKNKFFNLLLLSLVMATAISLSACGGNNGNAGNTPEDSSQSVTEDMKDIGNDMMDTAEDATKNAGDAVKDGADAVKDAVDGNR